MAMMWIEIHQELWAHPKTTKFVHGLKIDPVYAGGLLSHFGCWSIDNALPDGEIGDTLSVEIAAAAGWKKALTTILVAIAHG